MKSTDGMVIAIDTREQRPYEFTLPHEVKTLRTGDYSIVGLEHRIAIERKSKADAYATIGKGRNRFVRELERMADLDYAAIVIESSLRNLLIPPTHSSRMSPRSVIGSLLTWSVRFRIHIFFADDRAHACALVTKVLSKYYEEERHVGRLEGLQTKPTGVVPGLRPVLRGSQDKGSTER